MKIGRNDPCPCGSGLKYKKCCLNKSTPDIYQCIRDTVAEKEYPPNLSYTLCEMLRYMREKQFWGACHATASVLYVALSEQGFQTELCVGEIGSPDMRPFDHSWVTVDGQIIDLACYMPLPNPDCMIASNPIVLSTDVVTKNPPRLTYGIETGLGLGRDAKHLLNTSFVEYMDKFPLEKNGLWTTIQRISPGQVDLSELRKKYEGVQRKVCKNHAGCIL